MAKEKEKKVKKENKYFMKDVKAELKKVTWPTSKQMVNNVTAVIVIVLITAAIVFCLDLVFGAMNKYGIEKIKEQVQSNNQTEIINNELDNENQDITIDSEDQDAVVDGDNQESTDVNEESEENTQVNE